MVLDRSFYLNADVVQVARDLLGKVIVTGAGRSLTSGIITETEAYAGEGDRASHAFGGRRTARNGVMYASGGAAYVYLCYGIHRLFNVVTNKEGVPHAVLVRAIHPLVGLRSMHERRGPKASTLKPARLCGGPGTLTVALGIGLHHNGCDLRSGQVRIADEGIAIAPGEVIVGPRIGVDYAGDDALLPYRFRVAPSRSFAAQ